MTTRVEDKVAYLLSINNKLKTLEGKIGKIGAGLVFDTYEDMIEWLSNEDNLRSLTPGQSIFIKDSDTPDYWFTGTEIMEIIGEKVDLTPYATKIEVMTSIQNAINDKPTRTEMTAAIDKAISKIPLAELPTRTEMKTELTTLQNTINTKFNSYSTTASVQSQIKSAINAIAIPDISKCVTTNTQQTITAKKIFTDNVEFRNSISNQTCRYYLPNNANTSSATFITDNHPGQSLNNKLLYDPDIYTPTFDRLKITDRSNSNGGEWFNTNLIKKGPKELALGQLSIYFFDTEWTNGSTGIFREFFFKIPGRRYVVHWDANIKTGAHNGDYNLYIDCPGVNDGRLTASRCHPHSAGEKVWGTIIVLYTTIPTSEY